MHFTPLFSNDFFVIRTFDTYLNKIEDDVKIAEISKETFIKIFHIKEEIGGYIYFDKIFFHFKILVLMKKKFLVYCFFSSFILLFEFDCCCPTLFIGIPITIGFIPI